MTQYDSFESELAVAMRDYVGDAPTSIDPAAYVRALRQAKWSRPAGLLPWRLPRYRWLTLAALLAVALLAAVAVGLGDQPSVLPAPSPTATAAPTSSPSPTATPPAAGETLAFIRDRDLWMLTEGAIEPVLVADDVRPPTSGDLKFISNDRFLYWSPSGTDLAFETPTCIGLFDAESSAVRDLPGCPIRGGLAGWGLTGWAGDDSSLMVQRYGSAAGVGFLTVNRATGEWTERSKSMVCVPVVSPDGEWIAAVGGSVLVASTDDYVWSVVGANSGYSCGPFTGWDAPTWSPDSERIAFVSGLDGVPGAGPDFTPSARASISTVNRDGTALFVLTEQAAAWALPKWSPDGDWISYRGNDGLHLIRPDGTGDRLIHAGDIDRGRVSWAGDGSRIYFGVPAGGAFYGDTALWVYDMTTDSAEQVSTGGLITDFAPRP